jgi:hypothetical protein
MTYLEDHGLPLVQLRERRRELIVALSGSQNVSAHEIAEIATLQHAIAAIEAVICDLDAEATTFAMPRASSKLRLVA